MERLGEKFPPCLSPPSPTADMPTIRATSQGLTGTFRPLARANSILLQEQFTLPNCLTRKIPRIGVRCIKRLQIIQLQIECIFSVIPVLGKRVQRMCKSVVELRQLCDLLRRNHYR